MLLDRDRIAFTAGFRLRFRDCSNHCSDCSRNVTAPEFGLTTSLKCFGGVCSALLNDFPRSPFALALGKNTRARDRKTRSCTWTRFS